MPMRSETRTDFWRLLHVLGLFVAAGLVIAIIFRKESFHVEPDGRMIFRQNRPFATEFHRGGDYSPSHIISINEDGRVAVRIKPWGDLPQPGDVKAVFQLSPDDVRAIARSIIRHDLRRLHKRYDFEYVSHASEWSISIQQGSQRKESSFRHIFPRSIEDFARELDEILEAAAFRGEPRPRVDQIADEIPDRYASATGGFQEAGRLYAGWRPPRIK